MHPEKSKSIEKCRCCIHSSSHFIELTQKFSEAEEKSYSDILHEIINKNIINEHEQKMPQYICRKCIKRLRNAYDFIMQARNAYDFYLQIEVAKVDPELFDNLNETLIEMPELKNVIEEEDSQLEEISEHKCPEIFKDVFDISAALTNQDKVKEELDEEGGVLESIHFEDSIDEGDHEDGSTSDFDDDGLKSLDEDLAINEPIARRCDICHKVYRDERALNIHKRFTHMPEDEKLPCPLCNYKTSRPSALKVHMGLIHGPEKVEEHFKPLSPSGKQFPCNLCERGYQRREDLRKHFKKKHKNPQIQSQKKRKEKTPKQRDEQCFLCACCGQSYTSKKALDGHLLSHTGERPYKCDICEKAFKRIKDMKAHRVIHSDEKPFQCSDLNCGKAFKRADKLKIHMRVHSELRPYKCKECEKTFKYPSVLRTHMHMHTGQTPFECKTCGEAFSLRTSLNNHCSKNGHVK